MPGSVANAAPATVLPNSLCRAFVNTREFPVIDNEYRNGESRRAVPSSRSSLGRTHLTDSGRKTALPYIDPGSRGAD